MTARAARLELWRERLEPLDVRVHLNIGADEHLPAGADNPWTTWRALNRLRTLVGRSRVNVLKWGFSNEQETCECGSRHTMQHLLVCPMMDTACSPKTRQRLTVSSSAVPGIERARFDRHTTPSGRTRLMMMVAPKLLSWLSCTGQRGGSHTGCAVSEQTDSEEGEPDHANTWW